MPQSPREADILIVTAQIDPVVQQLAERLRANQRVDIHCSGAASVWGERRSLLAKAAFFLIDPLVTMFRLARRVWRYRLIICYYYRNGYWLGILKRLLGRHRSLRLVWVGFAPNPRAPGLRGTLKEVLTRLALSGCDLVICNTRPLIRAISARFAGVERKLAFVRWGGGRGRPPPENLVDDGYVFCGGRTNRDFDTVLEAVTALRARTVLVVGEDTRFGGHVPDFVTVYRNIPDQKFQSLIERARIVVVALKRPDISSGQVVLMQAMRCGKPTVVSATAGIDDYVVDGSDVLLFEPGSPQELGACLSRLLADPALRRAIGEAAANTYEQRFNSSAYARDLHAALEERSLLPGREQPLGRREPSAAR